MVQAVTASELMFTAITAYRELGGSATNQELYDWVAESGIYSDEQLAIPHTSGDMTSLEYRLRRWARLNIKLIGAVEQKEAGVWALTPLGETITEEEVARLHKLRQKEYQKSRSKKKKVGQKKLPANDTNEENFESEDEWKDELLEVLKNISPKQFEELTALTLRCAGFSKVKVTGRSSDGGIDGVGLLKINLVKFKVVFQCKRYKESVGAGAIRDFRGAKEGRGDRAIFVTTGTFTADAKREAEKDGAMLITLIDGDEFCDLLKEHELGVSTSATVNPSFFENIK